MMHSNDGQYMIVSISNSNTMVSKLGSNIYKLKRVVGSYKINFTLANTNNILVYFL